MTRAVDPKLDLHEIPSNLGSRGRGEVYVGRSPSLRRLPCP